MRRVRRRSERQSRICLKSRRSEQLPVDRRNGDRKSIRQGQRIGENPRESIKSESSMIWENPALCAQSTDDPGSTDLLGSLRQQSSALRSEESSYAWGEINSR